MKGVVPTWVRCLSIMPRNAIATHHCEKGKQMDSNDLFNIAYDLHYKTKDLESARNHYFRLILEFPDSKEARSAKAQLRTIELTMANDVPIAPAPVNKIHVTSGSELIASGKICPQCERLTVAPQGFTQIGLIIALAGLALFLFSVYQRYIMGVDLPVWIAVIGVLLMTLGNSTNKPNRRRCNHCGYTWDTNDHS